MKFILKSVAGNFRQGWQDREPGPMLLVTSPCVLWTLSPFEVMERSNLSSVGCVHRCLCSWPIFTQERRGNLDEKKPLCRWWQRSGLHARPLKLQPATLSVLTGHWALFLYVSWLLGPGNEICGAWWPQGHLGQAVGKSRWQRGREGPMKVAGEGGRGCTGSIPCSRSQAPLNGGTTWAALHGTAARWGVARLCSLLGWVRGALVRCKVVNLPFITGEGHKRSHASVS